VDRALALIARRLADPAFVLDHHPRLEAGARSFVQVQLAGSPCRTGVDERRVSHSDRGVHYLSIRHSERLAENEIVASVGSRGDSFDNAMAESFHGLYTWELIYPQGPWRGLDDVESATLGYVDWFNHRRLHGEITGDNSYVTPAEFEAHYYRQAAPASEAAHPSPSVAPRNQRPGGQVRGGARSGRARGCHRGGGVA
jgi:transposase InsO family protein